MEESLNDNPAGNVSTKKRGFWLTAFLVLMLLANPFTAYIYFTNPESVIDAYPGASVGLIYFLGLMCAVNVILAIGIFNWKKWGVYGFYAIAGTAFIINLYIGLGIGGSIIGLAGALIIFLLTRKKFHQFC